MKKDTKNERPIEKPASEMDIVIQRLYVEFCELQDRYTKLELFITSHKFQQVSTTQRVCMISQYRAMGAYKEELIKRLVDLQDQRDKEQKNSDCAN